MPRPAQRKPPQVPHATHTGLCRSALAGMALALCALQVAAAPEDCQVAAAVPCYQTLQLPQIGGSLHYYASLTPGSAGLAAPRRALIALHGHSRDAIKTFDAALSAVRQGGGIDDTLVIAPVFQVPAQRAERCSTLGVPQAQSGDLLWTCAAWMQGGRASNGGRPGSFEVLDAFIDELSTRWPSLQTITVAGFSAGAQMVQRYAAFARNRPAGAPQLRYVVADPSSWLYFDPERPMPVDASTCPTLNQWKYGTDDLPAWLNRSAQQARQHYVAADISYLEGALDNGPGKGKAYRLLDRSCAAQAQGPDRLARGLAYAQYDRTLLAPDKARQVVVVPGCAHDVACVFPSAAARAALLGSSRP